MAPNGLLLNKPQNLSYEFSLFFFNAGTENNFFMDVAGHPKTFQIITLESLPLNNCRVIAPIVQKLVQIET